jgi:HlyD family secretion protein
MKTLTKYLRAAWVVALVLGVLALGVGGYWFYQQQQAQQQQAAQAAQIRAEVIGRGNLTSKVSATGSILPNAQANLFFLTPGTVANVLVSNGDTVKAGQVLARLEATALQLAVSQATDALNIAKLNRAKLLAGPTEADIAVAKANLRSANAQLADLIVKDDDPDVKIAQLRYDSAYADYQSIADRYNALVQFAKDYPMFAPAQDTLDSLKTSMELAYYNAEVARLQVVQTKQGAGRGQLSVGYAQIAQAQAVLSQTLAAPSPLQIDRADLAIAQAETALAAAQLRLDHAELRAPFDGIVAIVNLKVGEPSSTGANPPMVLIDTSEFHLDVTVDEVDIAQLRLGQPVSVTLDALPEVVLNGQVDRLAPTGHVAGGLVTYVVRLVLAPTAAPLRAGMSATAEIVVAEVRDVILVPNWAIRRDRRTGQAYVSLKVGDELQERPIETGRRGDSYTEVTSGISVGDVAAVSTSGNTLDFLNP